jgi:hypothetical protein
MKKLLALSFFSMFVVSQAHAGFISAVNGDDMAGISVTVTLDDNTSETLVWAATGLDEGGVFGTLGVDGWSLVESGDTLGGLVNQSLFGVWTLANQTGQAIKSLFVDLSATNVVFDTLFGDVSANGSSAGREFTYDTRFTTVNAGFSMNYMDELFKGLTITGPQGGFLADGASFGFMIDTDIVTVPAPATLSILALSLLGLAARSRRKQA